MWVVCSLSGCFGEQIEAWMGPEAEEGECPWVQEGCGEVVTKASWGYGAGEQGLSWQEAFCRGHEWGFTIDFCSPQCYA